MTQDNSSPYPPLSHRIYAVWYRHMRVYSSNLLSNGLPPFLEPLIFLAGIGLGLGKYVPGFGNVPYVVFLAMGLPITTAMMTAAFECSFGTFINLEFNKVYDGMLAAPISVNNLIIGEMLWAATKGFFFAFAVLVVTVPFGVIPLPGGLVMPFIGFITGLMFASLSLLVTSYVKTISFFNFYFTGFLSPMFFLSGVVFPLAELPEVLRYVAEALPLTHPVRLGRSLCLGQLRLELLFDVLYIAAFIALAGYLALKRLRRRLID
ncbi:ABC transporter permease [Candidatus Magnetominusculus xianensis]|uniref:Transport permease protein n=1 Tax=Candidatus Magnetominusculus xianensis TaxID=1748249 RepID=A0ABR5SGY9_9BACT|nr:ABC transporter permease [Candidatus Magnetominusculus xianensis]KWT90955.1 ABC transporter permease [Candidatus Magnetominusculus xianensis]MBF0403111.1 ABC transporter permease [Nitrospirota bacterium]